MADDIPRLFVGSLPLQKANVERNGEMLESLADRLLSLGGKTVVVPPDHPEYVTLLVPQLLRVGQKFDAGTAELEPGNPNDCHANSSALWREGRGALCIGYALSEDMLWRSHSWVQAPTGRLIETTEVREAYFGWQLDDEGAELFAEPA